MVTIKEVAKAAGVSVTTVSRALNGYSDVNEDTRRKIKQVAEELSYTPSAVARSLVSKKTRTIGVVLSEINRLGVKDAFSYEVLCGINDRAGELNYDILLFSTNPKKQMKKSYSELLRERHVDGAILSGLRMNDLYVKEVAEQTHFPCVLIDIPVTGKMTGHVGTDNVNGALKAVDYLLSIGHRNIAMINGHSEAAVSEERLNGYIEALKQAHLPYDPEKVFDGNYTEDGGTEAMYQILLRFPDVTAVFCASDLMALGAMKALERMGKKVPGDVSIIGFDDITIASYTSPKLTTIRQDKYEMGYRSAQMLIDMLEERQVENPVTLNNELIIRESVAPPSLPKK